MIPGLVSVIIPVHNRGRMLTEAVQSVLAQTYRPLEILIVDDASTDDTPAVIAALSAAHPEIRPLRRANGGPGAARETGRQQAVGEFIQYLDSDDLLLPEKLSSQVALLHTSPSSGVAYGWTRYRDAMGQEIPCTWKESRQVQQTILPSFLVSRWWETSAPLYRRQVTEAAGPWTDLRLEEDWEYDCRVGALGVQLVHVDQVVAEHRDHPDDRLSRGAALDPTRLRDRAQAHLLVAGHARIAGLNPSAPEILHFSRALFLLARQCGAAGLSEESGSLLQAASTFSERRDLRLYLAFVRLVGPIRAGRLSAYLDRLR